MPRAQSPPRGTRAHSRASPLVHKHPSMPHQPSPDVLEFTSSDDTPLSPHLHHKQVPSLTTKKKPKPKVQLSSVDVIEISSDDDGVLPSRESAIADLRSQVKKLKQERDKHLNDSKSLAQEVARCHTELKESKHKSTDGKLVLDPSDVDDALSCEICTARMYTPYLLPDCGHTFCLSCLRDWFGTTHARFIQTNPQWQHNGMNPYVARIQAILRPEYLAHPQLFFQLQQLQQPTPEYTCPTCRKRIYRRPVEVYALKSLVRTISAANKDEKEQVPPDQPFVERRHGHLVVVDPWDGYFPKEHS